MAPSWVNAARDSTKMAVRRFNMPREARRAKNMKKKKASGWTFPTGLPNMDGFHE